MVYVCAVEATPVQYFTIVFLFNQNNKKSNHFLILHNFMLFVTNNKSLFSDFIIKSCVFYSQFNIKNIFLNLYAVHLFTLFYS